MSLKTTHRNFVRRRKIPPEVFAAQRKNYTLTKNQVRVLRALHGSDSSRCWVKLMTSAGMRTREIQALIHAHVDLESHSLLLSTDKNIEVKQ